jgi:hypothetical protein
MTVILLPSRDVLVAPRRQSTSRYSAIDDRSYDQVGYSDGGEQFTSQGRAREQGIVEMIPQSKKCQQR